MKLLKELLLEDYDETPVMKECDSCGEIYNGDENDKECPHCGEKFED
jgi:rubrerythrin